MSTIGNKEVFAKNLRRLMECQQKDRRRICDDLGFKYTTFTDWYNGNKYPRIDKIELLANYFGVLKSDLIEDKSTFPSEQIYGKGVKIPVLGDVAAGVPIEAITDIIDYEEIPESMAKSGDYFGLRIKGRSMEPRMIEGDVVIVRKQDDVESGDIAVVLVNGDSAAVKKLQKKANGIVLMSFNPTYDPVFYSEAEVRTLPVVIIGRVVELRGKF